MTAELIAQINTTKIEIEKMRMEIQKALAQIHMIQADFPNSVCGYCISMTMTRTAYYQKTPNLYKMLPFMTIMDIEPDPYGCSPMLITYIPEEILNRIKEVDPETLKWTTDCLRGKNSKLRTYNEIRKCDCLKCRASSTTILKWRMLKSC